MAASERREDELHERDQGEGERERGGRSRRKTKIPPHDRVEGHRRDPRDHRPDEREGCERWLVAAGPGEERDGRERQSEGDDQRDPRGAR